MKQLTPSIFVNERSFMDVEMEKIVRAVENGNLTVVRPTVYYAHSIALFGTPQAGRDVKTLEDLGFDVVNPDAPEHDEGYQEKGMDYFKDIVQHCDALAFRANPDMSINAGIAKEIDYAREAGLPVIELPSMTEARSLPVSVTRQYLKEQGHR